MGPEAGGWITQTPVEFEVIHETKFISIIRGHHVYKTIWNAVIGEILYVQLDHLKEALECDKCTMGIFKTNQYEECLIGHVRIETSSYLYHFLQEDKSNSIKVKVIGKRKREVGLVIPATFIAHTGNKRTAEIFNTELAKRRKMFTIFELKYKLKRFFRALPVFDLKL